MVKTFMMVLDHVGDQEAMVYAQLGQQPLARTTETSLEPRLGTLSCLSAQPPDLATTPPRRPHSPRWRACGRALSHFYTPSARRRRDPRARVMDETERFVAVLSELAVELPGGRRARRGQGAGERGGVPPARSAAGEVTKIFTVTLKKDQAETGAT